MEIPYMKKLILVLFVIFSTKTSWTQTINAMIVEGDNVYVGTSTGVFA